MPRATVRPPHVIAGFSLATLLLLAGLATLSPAALEAQAPAALPTGAVANGALGMRGEAAKYRYAATGAGILTVAVNGVADLVLSIMDEDGQVLPDGRADRDLRGVMGAEMLAVVLPRRGSYLVEIGANSAGGAVPFTISAAFAPMPAFERAEDADGRPGNARVLEPGMGHEDALNLDDGDASDWYTLRAASAMTVFVMTRMPEGASGDLVLEAFIGGVFTEPTVRSDQDLQGNTGNETVSVDLKAGEVLHVRVSAHGERGSAMPYRISVTRAP